MNRLVKICVKGMMLRRLLLQEGNQNLEKTEDKVADMVNKMKRHGEKKPSAAELVEEVKKEDKKQNIAVPSIQELAQKKDVEHKSAEQLTKELLRKGTLRK